MIKNFRKIFLLPVLMAAAILHGDELLSTGSKVSHLPSPLFLDGSNHTLSEFLNKKYLVLWIWEDNSASLQEIPAIKRTAQKTQDPVSFLGIGIGDAAKLAGLPGIKNLPFPVNVDKGGIKKLFFRPNDQTPLTVLLDKNGTLLWRGKLHNLSRIINSCESGRFNLPERIRLETFNTALNQAITGNDLPKAIKMLDEEYRKYPRRITLLSLQIKLLRQLNRYPEIFQALHNAQKLLPNNHRLFEMEYHLIGETADDRRRPDFFSRLKKNFANYPQVLLGVAVAELQIPPAYLDLDNVLELAALGWQSSGFTTREQRGAYAVEYARILHSVGRNDLAAGMAKQALELLKKDSSLWNKAEAAAVYYTKLQKIAPSIRIPDLKK